MVVALYLIQAVYVINLIMRDSMRLDLKSSYLHFIYSKPEKCIREWQQYHVKCISQFKGARGKYSKKYKKGTNVVIIDPDVAEFFPDNVAVNEALRSLIPIIKKREKRVAEQMKD